MAGPSRTASLRWASDPNGIVGAWLRGRPLGKVAHLALGLVAPAAFAAIGALRVRDFTLDGAYVTFRYAENLAAGQGLVYNVGERVEGYSNLLWTLLLTIAIKLGVGVETAAKALGVASIVVAIAATFFVSRRLRPHGVVPCVATWLLASSVVFTGQAVFGTEAALAAALSMIAVELFCRELEQGRGAPWSGLVFALATLTRPEALLIAVPLFAWHAWRPRADAAEAARTRRRWLVRLALLAGPLILQLAFRRIYYDAWVPNTLSAKLGGARESITWGIDYARNYVRHVGVLFWLTLGSVATSIVGRRRLGLALATSVVLFGVYLLVVGGDGAPYFRLLAPAEPILFLLVDDVVRAVFEAREAVAAVALALLLLVSGVQRTQTLRDGQRGVLADDKTFWDESAGRTAAWFVERGKPGPIAIGDIGYVGFQTHAPIIDLLGFQTPEIAALPGAPTKKVGAGFTDAVFGRDPRYVVLVAAQRDCTSPTTPTSIALFRDDRFATRYVLRDRVVVRSGAAWCIHERR